MTQRKIDNQSQRGEGSTNDYETQMITKILFCQQILFYNFRKNLCKPIMFPKLIWFPETKLTYIKWDSFIVAVKWFNTVLDTAVVFVGCEFCSKNRNKITKSLELNGIQYYRGVSMLRDKKTKQIIDSLVVPLNCKPPEKLKVCEGWLVTVLVKIKIVLSVL